MSKNNFWGKNPNLTPPSPCSDDEFALFEKKHQVKLPRELKELYMIQNGGHINFPNFRKETASDEYKDYCYDDLIENMLRIDVNDNGINQSIAPVHLGGYDDDLIQLFRTNCGDLNLIFPFEGDGHTYYALNYNENKEEPNVVCVDAECEFTMHEVYSSFRSFLNSKSESEEYPHKEIQNLNIKVEIRAWNANILHKGFNKNIHLEGKIFNNKSGHYCLYSKEAIYDPTRFRIKLFVFDRPPEENKLRVKERGLLTESEIYEFSIVGKCVEYSSDIIENGQWDNRIDDSLWADILIPNELWVLGLRVN